MSLTYSEKINKICLHVYKINNNFVIVTNNKGHTIRRTLMIKQNQGKYMKYKQLSSTSIYGKYAYTPCILVNKIKYSSNLIV
jgi:hypothetical protein